MTQNNQLEISLLLKEILPIPSNEVVANRFSKESASAVCRGACTGACRSATA